MRGQERPSPSTSLCCSLGRRRSYHDRGTELLDAGRRPRRRLGDSYGCAGVRMGHGVTAYAMFLGEIGQANATYYGGQVGVNVALDAWRGPAQVF